MLPQAPLIPDGCCHLRMQQPATHSNVGLRSFTCQDLFPASLSQQCSAVAFPAKCATLSASMLWQPGMLVCVLFAAPKDFSQDPDVLTWAASAYDDSVRGQDGGNPTFESRLREQYPTDQVIETLPATIVDNSGIVQMYYVPGALLPERQVRSDRLPLRLQLS